MAEQDKPPAIDPATLEAWDYLMEMIEEYASFLGHIGNLDLSAPQLLYYRDEVQEFLEELKNNPTVNYQGAYQKVNELDVILRQKAQELVDEIGHENFLQYQIINDPPRAHWWWWLNRITSPPPPPPKIWEFWKYQSFQGSNKEEEQDLSKYTNPEFAKMFVKPKEENPGSPEQEHPED